MKTITKILLAIILFSVQSHLFAQSDAEQKAWMDYMKPGPIHDMLAKSDGEWNEEVTMWMAPDAPPTKGTSTAVNKMILGGRYQYSTHKGEFMGMPFEGINILGYDNAKKIFVSSWVDNMGTGVLYTEGTWDEPTKSITFKGKEVDPLTGKDMDIRQVFKIINDKTQSIEMYMTQDGKEMKTMEIMLTKK